MFVVVFVSVCVCVCVFVWSHLIQYILISNTQSYSIMGFVLLRKWGVW